MNRDVTGQPAGIPPAKLALIGVLGVVLVVVLAIQFGGDDGPAVVLQKREPRRTVAAPAELPTGEERLAPSRDAQTTWPTISREEVLSFNPFAKPVALQEKPASSALAGQTPGSLQIAQSEASAPTSPAAPTAEELRAKEQAAQARLRAQERRSRITRIEATAAALRTQGVGLVINTTAGAVAQIGDQELRVGDVINDVLRVVQITPQGIVVEEASAELPSSALDEGRSAE